MEIEAASTTAASEAQGLSEQGAMSEAVSSGEDISSGGNSVAVAAAAPVAAVTPSESEYAAAVVQTAIALTVTAIFVVGIGLVEGVEKVRRGVVGGGGGTDSDMLSVHQ